MPYKMLRTRRQDVEQRKIRIYQVTLMGWNVFGLELRRIAEDECLFSAIYSSPLIGRSCGMALRRQRTPSTLSSELVRSR